MRLHEILADVIRGADAFFQRRGFGTLSSFFLWGVPVAGATVATRLLVRGGLKGGQQFPHVEGVTPVHQEEDSHIGGPVGQQQRPV